MITYHPQTGGGWNGWKQAQITRHGIRGSRERSNGECGFPAQGATAVTTKAGGTGWLRRDGMTLGTVIAMTRQDATTAISKTGFQDRVQALHRQVSGVATPGLRALRGHAQHGISPCSS
jgi:hypothetical protein